MFSYKLIVVLHVSLLGSDGLNAGEYHPQPNLKEHLDQVCMFNRICNTDNATRLPGWLIRPCCGECSCSATCGLTQNCCYPELDTYNLVDRSHQQCIVPVIYSPLQKKPKVQKLFSYNMVVDAFPRTSCVQGTGVDDTDCGNDETATPLGSLYPVYSRKTKRIYKNIKCAQCHGLKKNQVKPWNARIECDKFDSSLKLDVDTVYQTLESGQLSPNCRIVFSPPVSDYQVLTEECYTHAVNTCLPNNSFVVPEYLDMSHTQVRESCSSQLQSPYIYGGMYSNVFCYICNSVDKYLDIPGACQGEGRDTIDKQTFTFLLVPTFSLQTKDSDRKGERKRWACKDIGEGKIPSDCRHVHCPSGMVMADNESCVFPGLFPKPSDLYTVLKLIPQSNVSIASLEEFVSGSDIQTIFSLGIHWEVASVMYEKDESSMYVKNVVIIFSHAYNSDSSMKQLISDVVSCIQNELTVNFGDEPIYFEQMFSEYSDFILFNISNSNEKLYTLNVTAVESILPDSMRNLTLPALTEIMTSPDMTDEMVNINQMFYCDQISLKYHEYTLDKHSHILYHKEQRRIFFDNEFSVVYDMGLDDYVPRVCLSDSEMMLSSKMSVNSPLNHLTKSLICACAVFYVIF